MKASSPFFKLQALPVDASLQGLTRTSFIVQVSTAPAKIWQSINYFQNENSFIKIIN